MKNKITITLFTFAVGAIFIFNGTSIVANSGGAVGGNSSSGGDGGQSCGQGGCHGGGHTTSSTPLISTDIPVGGYIPGNTYNVTVTGTNGGVSKFGFELAAENTSNATAGTIIPSAREQLRGNGHITHRSTSTAPVSGTFNWQFQWTAPSSGTGNVKFSTAVLFANGNGSNSGDNTVISNITVTEDLTVSIDKKKELSIKAYPNPVIDYLYIDNEKQNTLSIQVYNQSGALVKHLNSSENQFKLDFSQLTQGVYYVNVSSKNKNKSFKLIKE